MAEFRIKRADIVAANPCNSPAVNMRYNDPSAPGYQRTPLEFFDRMVQLQGLDPTDLVFPDGWTELHSAFFYQRQPLFHQWAMKHGLIPQDDIAKRFPHPIAYSQYDNFPKDPP